MTIIDWVTLGWNLYKFVRGKLNEAKLVAVHGAIADVADQLTNAKTLQEKHDALKALLTNVVDPLRRR